MGFFITSINILILAANIWILTKIVDTYQATSKDIDEMMAHLQNKVVPLLKELNERK